MDYGRGLVTRIVDEQALSKSRRSGIGPEYLDEDIIPVYNYLERHYANYKVVPDRSTLKAAFPSFEYIETRQPVEYFIDALKESFRRSVLEDKIDAISQVYTKDTQRAEALLRDALSELVITQKTFRDVDVKTSASDRFEAYKLRTENPGASGILSGWPALDYETLGWMGEQFVVLVGEKWMGKSWIMLWLAYKAAMAGERVLFITREMSQDEITERFDSIYAHIPYGDLRRGELSYEDEKRYHEVLNRLGDSNLSFTIARQGVESIADIEFKAVETDATIVFGDSIYLFNPDRASRFGNETHRRMAISQKCKQIAQTLAVPFIVSVQAGRKQSKKAKPDIDDIEYSNAFSQDADVVIYLHKDELDKELGRAQMHLLKCRGGGQQIEFFIEQDFNEMRFPQREDSAEPSMDVFADDEETIFGETV